MSSELLKLERALEGMGKDCEALVKENEALKGELRALRSRVRELEGMYGIGGIRPEPLYTSKQVSEMDDERYAKERENIRRAREEGQFLHNAEGAIGRWKRKLKISN